MPWKVAEKPMVMASPLWWQHIALPYHSDLNIQQITETHSGLQAMPLLLTEADGSSASAAFPLPISSVPSLARQLFWENPE